MGYTFEEATRFIEENDVKFIRIAFCDILGNLKNISILPQELNKAFSSGVPFNASALKGFMNVAESDLLLFPDPNTLTTLPWRPSHGKVVRFLCSIMYPNGTPFEGDGRRFLSGAVNELKKIGYKARIGTESEFYLFKLDENGNQTNEPFDDAGYLDVAPLDKGENVRREICLTLEQMNMIPERSHHERGPGQNEIDFKAGGALVAADDLIAYKSVVSTIASQYGLWASFDPKPINDLMGNSLHINISLIKDDNDIFSINEEIAEKNICESFAAGVLRKIREITLFLNSTENSYNRLGKFGAPKFVTWSHQNKSQLMRIPLFEKSERMELRSPDSMCNPYFAFGLIIYAGIEGIKDKLTLDKPIDVNPVDLDLSLKKDLVQLPETLNEAIKLAKNSDFVNNFIPSGLFDAFMD